MDLFRTNLPKSRLHTLFQMLNQPTYLPERRVIESWAKGFQDRDGKFVNEFQTTFESSFWELYLHACLKEIGVTLDFSHHAPDFVVTDPHPFCLEATIAAPPMGGQAAYGYDAQKLPSDFNAFNAQAAIRIANSFSSKLRKYRDSYARLPHTAGRPFVIAIAAFDRPFAHFASNRPAVATLYGLNYDEQAALAEGPSATKVPSHMVSGAVKENGSSVPLGLFLDETSSEVSAVVYSCLATWGKLRALADNPSANSVYKTIHPATDGIVPEIRFTKKKDYHEHLMDGLYVFHNPHAKHPLALDVFDHPRVAQMFLDGDELMVVSPDDFLLMRMIQTIKFKE